MTSQQSITIGLADLQQFERGHAVFEIGKTGELCYRGTEATAKSRSNEDAEVFIQRLRVDHDLRQGDRIELLNNSGRLDTARICKQPRR